MRRNDTLTARQRAGIIHILTCRTIELAAKRTGVSRATFFRWMDQDAFRRALEDAQNQATQGAIRRLQAISAEAVETLAGIMKSRRAAPATKALAASRVLELSLKFRPAEVVRAPAYVQWVDDPNFPTEETPDDNTQSMAENEA